MLGNVLVPVPAGFSVVWKIGLEELQYWSKKAGVTDEDEDELYGLLQVMLSKWEQYKEIAPIEEADIELLQNLDKDDGSD